MSMGDALFWVGAVIMTVAFLAAALSGVRAQDTYLRLYKSLRSADLLLPQEFNARLREEPIQHMVETPGYTVHLWKLMWEPQPEPELEQARQRSVQRWLLMMAILLFGPLLPILLTSCAK